MKLTAKQEGFVLSILEGKSQADAYRANYNCENMQNDTIYVKANELMNNDKIKVRLEKLRNEQAKASKWTLEKLIDEFVAVKEKCMQEEPVMKYDKGLGEWVETGEYVFKEHGVIKALENIGKLLGHYEEKIKHSGEVKTNNPLKDLTTDELKKLIDK